MYETESKSCSKVVTGPEQAVSKVLFAKKSKEYSSLGNIISFARAYVKFDNEIKDLENIIDDKKNDVEIVEMAEKDLLIGPIFKRMWDEYNLDGFGGYFVKEEDLDSDNPYICPIKGDYTNSPPIMIQVGGAELLLSDSRTLKNVLERDGVEHEYKEWEDLWHVFQIEAMLPESIESFKMFGNFLNKHIGVKV